MDASLGIYGLSLLAGVLSILSPCVLPLVPILIGSAVLAHRFGPYALAAGLALSFAVVGVFVTAAGASLGLEQETLRKGAAILLLSLGWVLLLPGLQERFAEGVSSLASPVQTLLSRVALDGLFGQFLLGLVLGLVWSPCVGPTLGAAILLASQGEDLAHVTLVMMVFGMGASIPMVVFGLASRQIMMRLRGRLLETGKRGKQLLGAIMLVLGVAVFTGSDKKFESWVLDVAPGWLVKVTTKY